MIEVKRVSKKFGSKKAVDDVSFRVSQGEVLGFLGPNGAGKSTTMRMVTGFLIPDQGQVLVGDVDMAERPQAAKTHIGYLPENAPTYPEMTVQGFLRFAAEVRGKHGAERDKAVDRAIDMCFLHSVRHQMIDTLSKGYHHRTCFAQSILHDPPVLVMDEPTDGLDPNQKHEVRTLIRSMGANKSILFSTHILEEVEAVCSRVLIIDQGKIIADGSPEDLKARAPSAHHVEAIIRLPVKGDPADEIAKLERVASLEILSKRDNLLRLKVTPDRLDIRRAGEVAEAIASLCASKSWPLRELRPVEGRLDDVFRAITHSEIGHRQPHAKDENQTTNQDSKSEEVAA